MNLMPTEEYIVSVLKSMENNRWDEIIDTSSSPEEDENREKILLLFGPNGDPDFMHEYKRDIRLKITNYVEDLSINKMNKLEYMLEFMLSGMLSVTMLWVENDENMSEHELEKLFSEVMENGLKQVFTDILSKSDS